MVATRAAVYSTVPDSCREQLKLLPSRLKLKHPPPPLVIFNSYGAIVAQERRKVGCCDYATRCVSTEGAKTLANEAKYSTNKGLYVWSFTVPSCKEKSND